MSTVNQKDETRSFHDRLYMTGLNPNPSLFVHRIPAMLVALAGLLCSAFNFETTSIHAADSLIISTFTLSLLLNFIGSEDRWRTNPWLVIANGFLLGPIGFCAGIWLVVLMQTTGIWNIQEVIESVLALLLIAFLTRESSAAFATLRKARSSDR